MVKTNLPLYVPNFTSQCSGHRILKTLFPENIDIIVLLISYHPQVDLLKPLWNDNDSSTG